MPVNCIIQGILTRSQYKQIGNKSHTMIKKPNRLIKRSDSRKHELVQKADNVNIFLSQILNKQFVF